MKISHIALVSVCGIAWALYGTIAQATLYNPTPDQSAVFFILPSFQKIILTIITAQAFVFSLWFGISCLLKRSLGINLRESLKKATTSLHPSLSLFLLSGLFTPYIHPLYKLSKFFSDLGLVFPSIVLVSIFLKELKFRFNAGRLVKLVASIPERKFGLMLFVFVLAVYIFFTLRLVPLNAAEDKRYYLLTGDGALLPGLADYISKALNVNASIANPWMNISIDNKFKDIISKSGPSYSVAIGLALKDE